MKPTIDELIQQIRETWKKDDKEYQEIIWCAGKQVLGKIIKRDFDNFYKTMGKLGEKAWLKTEGFIPDVMLDEIFNGSETPTKTIQKIEKLYNLAKSRKN